MQLDSFQREIVNSTERNVLVVASPGSGKTTVIINRAGYLIQKSKVDTSSIIIITFTRAAAENMKNRYSKLFSDEGLPFFGTFHSFFYNILKNHIKKIEIIDSLNAYRVIECEIRKSFGEVAEGKVKEVLNCISAYKTRITGENEFDYVIDKEVFLRCYNTYEEYKVKNSLLDFDDLQIKTLEVLQDSNIAEYYRKKYKYYLIDEFQDCDDMQVRIIKLLCQDNSLFAVGDEDQCIYGFRKARPIYMVEFDKHFNYGVKKYLTNNYRSAQRIVETSAKLISHNLLRNSKNFHGTRMEEGIIQWRSLDNEKEQSEDISNRIIKNVCKDKGLYKENAILYRTNLESRSIIDCFIRKRIPFTILDKEYNFYDHFICKDILAYLILSQDLRETEQFCRIINRPFRYISKVNIEKLRDFKYKRDCFDAICEITTLPFFQYRELKSLRRHIVSLDKLSVVDAVDFVINKLKYIDFIRNYALKGNMQIEELMEIVYELKTAARDFTSISEFIEHIKILKNQINNKNANKNDSVIISTIHGVKGMEFNNVYIINCVEGLIPYRHIDKINNIEEERRLFYVAVTRARDKVVLLSPRVIRGKHVECSNFITECGIVTEMKKIIEYNEGLRVLHKSYGEGRVKYTSSMEICITFNDGTDRCFDINALLRYDLLQKLQ